MSKMTIDALKTNLDNVARGYLWEVIFANPIGNGTTDTYHLRCRSTSIPGRSVGKLHVPFKQTAGIEFPGKITYSHSWTCTFIEGEDRKIFNDLNSWCNQIIDSATGMGSTKIKTDVTLFLLNTDGTTADKIKLIGVYLQEISDTGLDYGNEGEVIISATFSYDRWEKA